jgi:hypothetical protein
MNTRTSYSIVISLLALISLYFAAIFVLLGLPPLSEKPMEWLFGIVMWLTTIAFLWSAYNLWTGKNALWPTRIGLVGLLITSLWYIATWIGRLGITDTTIVNNYVLIAIGIGLLLSTLTEKVKSAISS